MDEAVEVKHLRLIRPIHRPSIDGKCQSRGPIEFLAPFSPLGRIRRHDRLGGLIHEYQLVA
jgi:hypothetical protein